MGILFGGCSSSPYRRDQSFHKEWECVKSDLNNMSDKDIANYFNECISKGKIFFYKGGYTNALLVDKNERELACPFVSFSLGCTGGVPEGAKFNKLMINYIRTNKIKPAQK